MPVWQELSQWPMKHLIYSKTPVTLKIRSRSAKSNQLLELVTIIFLCALEEIPSAGSLDSTYKTMKLKLSQVYQN